MSAKFVKLAKYEVGLTESQTTRYNQNWFFGKSPLERAIKEAVPAIRFASSPEEAWFFRFQKVNMTFELPEDQATAETFALIDAAIVKWEENLVAEDAKREERYRVATSPVQTIPQETTNAK